MRSIWSVPEYTTILGQEFSPCGKYFVAGTDCGRLAVWAVSQLLGGGGEAERGRQLASWKVEPGLASLLTIDRFLVVGGRGILQAWEWETIATGEVGNPSWELRLPGPGDINSMAGFTEAGVAGQLVLGAGDNKVHLVDLESRVVVRELAGHTGYIHSVVVAEDADRTVASCGEDGTVRLWDGRRAGDCLHTLTPHMDSDLARPAIGKHVSALAVNRDWLACGGGPRMALWNVKALAMAVRLPPEDHEANCASFHDEIVIVGGRGRTLYQADLSGDLKAEVAMSSSVVYSLAHRHHPNMLCCAGSSSNIDICAPNISYKDVSITFPTF